MSNRALKTVPHVWFARDAATIDSQTIGREVKPDMDPEANWTSLGIVTSRSVTDDSEDIEIMKGQPGKVMRQDVIADTAALTHTLELTEMNEIALELIYGTAAAVATTFQPGFRGAILKGWLHFQDYDEKDQLILNMDVFCALRATGGAAQQRGIWTATIEARQLYSSLTTGNLSNL